MGSLPNGLKTILPVENMCGRWSLSVRYRSLESRNNFTLQFNGLETA